MSKELISFLIPENDFLSTFGCHKFEMEIRDCIISALAKGELPNFEAYNNPNIGECSCRSSLCDWNEAEVMSRLEKSGLWDKVVTIHENITLHPIQGKRNDDGTITVFDINGVFPYVGEYKKMTIKAMKTMLDCCPRGFVFRQKDAEPGLFILARPDGMKVFLMN